MPQAGPRGQPPGPGASGPGVLGGVGRAFGGVPSPSGMFRGRRARPSSGVGTLAVELRRLPPGWMAAPESRAADPARTRPSSPQRPSVHPARGRIRNRHNHCLLNTFALAAPAPTLDHTVRAASAKASALLDGTPLPVDRIAADSPFHSGQTQETRDGRAGRRGSVRRAAVGVTRSATMSVQPASMVSSTLSQRPTSPSGLARDAKEPRARSVFPAAASAPPPLTQDALPPHYTEVMLPPEFSLPDSER